MTQFQCTNTGYAMYCGGNYGPTFGGGHDLYVSNGQAGTSGLGHSYTGTNASNSFFFGQPQFTATDYIVYKLT